MIFWGHKLHSLILCRLNRSRWRQNIIWRSSVPNARKNIATKNVRWIQFKHAPSVQKIILHRAAPHFLDWKRYIRNQKKNQNRCTWSTSVASGSWDNLVCFETQPLLFSLHSTMLNNMVCGKINLNPHFQTGHHNHFLLQTHGWIIQINLVGRISLIIHHIGKISHILRNGLPLLHKVHPGRQTGKDRCNSQ